MSSFNTIQSFKLFAEALATQLNMTAIINAQVAMCREAGVEFALRESKVNPCPNKAALRDALKAAFPKGKAKQLQNYETSFIAAVRGKGEFKLGNAKSAKGTKVKASKGFAEVLARAFSHPEFADFMAGLQVSYDDAMGDLHALTKEFLEAEGIEFPEAKQ